MSSLWRQFSDSSLGRFKAAPRRSGIRQNSCLDVRAAGLLGEVHYGEIPRSLGQFPSAVIGCQNHVGLHGA
jgi:hypothetical protein